VTCETAEETFVCPEVGGNGNYADPATCRRFYQVFCFFLARFFLFLTIEKLATNL